MTQIYLQGTHYSLGTTTNSAPKSKTKSSYPFHQNNWRNMIISSKAKEQKLILILHIMIKLGPKIEGYCSHTKFKEHIGRSRENISNLLITNHTPNYFYIKMKPREKIRGNSPTTTNKNVQDMGRPIRRRTFQDRKRKYKANP